ncbi:MAG: carboxypeptidase regulatory-like domain-containing protein [Elusimicrobia bacterium]|nr:carboxypeptidase regulatory-like domain-containing protein [Elusimicrobiota bacterium]
MNTKLRCLSLAGALALAVGATAHAVSMNGTVNLTGGLVGPVFAQVAVATYPVINPSTAFTPSVYVASVTVQIPSVVGTFSFPSLPFFTPPTPYYVYAYIDADVDEVIDPLEPCGGYGPFPYHQPTATMTAVSNIDSGSVSLDLLTRGAIEGWVSVMGGVTGDRLMIRAVEDVAAPNTTLTQYTSIPLAGGFYSLPHLKPLANAYKVEAWIDSDFVGVPYAWDANEPKFNVSSLMVTANTISNAQTLLISGPGPDHIRLTGNDMSTHQTIVVDRPSSPLKVTVRDAQDQLVEVPEATALYFEAYSVAGNMVPELSVGGDAFQPVPGPMYIAAALSESEPLVFRSTQPGHVTLRVEARDFPSSGQSRYSWYDFDVLPAGSGFTNVGVRTNSQPAGAGLSTSTVITPDNDGANDSAVFSCTPPALETPWELWISSDSSIESSVIYRYYGYGTGEAYWHGYDHSGRRVPSATYYARFQTNGQGIVSSTLTVVVQSVGITGRVVDGQEQPIFEAEVNVYGQNGGGFQLTDSDGQFNVSGLKPLSFYNVELRKSGYQTVRFSTSTNLVTDPAVDLGTRTLEQGITLAVHVDVSAAPNRDIFGGVNVFDPAARDNQWGSVRISSGSTASDNGRYNGDAQFSTWTFITVRPNTMYQVEVNLPDFGRSTAAWTSPATGIGFLTFNMTRKPNVYGKVFFPSPLTIGQWVNVDARLDQQSMSTAWGGAWINAGAQEGLFSLYGLSDGTYHLRAYAQGFVASTASVTVDGEDVGHPNTGGVDFAPFSKGGKITGDLTVTGDTTGLSSSGPGGSCANNEFAVPLNANSRSSFMGTFTQACLPKSANVSSASYEIAGLADGTYEVYSYLPGFEFSSNGPLQVTVANSSGTANLGFVALAGSLTVVADLPADDDAALVSYELSLGYGNTSSWSGVLTASGPSQGVATVTGLGTGLYTLQVENGNRDLDFRRELVVPVKNGSAATAQVDLTVPSYEASGEIDIQGTLVLPSTWSVSVSSITGLAAAGVIPQVDVYALPFPNHYETRSGPIRTVPADVHSTSATYRIPGLSSGGYWLRVRQDLVPPPAGCYGCMSEPGLPDLSNEGAVIYVDTQSLTGVDLTLTNGVDVSGTLNRPSGDTTSDTRIFKIRLRRSDNFTVWQTTVTSVGAATAYRFSHVAPGDYILEITDQGMDARYGAKAVPIKVAAAAVTKNVTLLSGGTIVGRLRDADSQTLINAQNSSQYLPQNFGISAQANPWVQGGWVEALRSTTTFGFYFDADGQFRIPRLIPDTNYDLRFRGYDGLDNADRASGVKTYAPTVIAGILASEGQSVDVGTVDLKQGVTLSGTVLSVSSQPLANVRVIARPSVKSTVDTWNLQVEAYTDEDGRYSLQGIDRAYTYYDIVAAPRYRPGETFASLSGPRYAEERRRMVDVTVATATVDNNFSLTEAIGVVTGQVVPVDGGTLAPVFLDDQSGEGLRGADVVLHRDGAMFEDNPLGEIEERTAPDGTFRVEGLKPGPYTLRALAQGYVTSVQTLLVPAGSKDVGTLTLGRGATVTGTLTKPGGAAVNSEEVEMVVGVDEDFEDFLFGSLDIDAGTMEIEGYTVSGFQVGKEYSLIIVTDKDDIFATGSTVAFTVAGETQVINLEYRAAAPRVFVNQTQRVVLNDPNDSADDQRVTSVRFFVSQPLRNQTPGDTDLSSIVIVSSGAGTLSDLSVNSSRDTLTADYTAPATEPSFVLGLNFLTIEKDPATGDNFEVDETFAFYAGFAKRRSTTVSNVIGGDVQLEDEASGVTFPSGTFDVASSSSVEVEIRILEELPPASVPAAKSSGRNGSIRSSQASVAHAAKQFGASAYPSQDLYEMASAAAAVDPYSAFYDIFLPAGIKSVLKKSAQLTLTYDPDIASDPNTLNIYFYHPEKQLFILENANRVVDEVNHTITVSVGHLSTFLVLNNQDPVLGGEQADAGYNGDSIQVFNTPNPFRLASKTVSLSHTTPNTATTDGTYICYNLPDGKMGGVKIEIYDAAGVLVRTLSATASSDESYNRLEWDGRNDDGRKVASGIYIGRFTLNSGDEKMFKLAVLK